MQRNRAKAKFPGKRRPKSPLPLIARQMEPYPLCQLFSQPGRQASGHEPGIIQLPIDGIHGWTPMWYWWVNWAQSVTGRRQLRAIARARPGRLAIWPLPAHFFSHCVRARVHRWSHLEMCLLLQVCFGLSVFVCASCMQGGRRRCCWLAARFSALLLLANIISSFPSHSWVDTSALVSQERLDELPVLPNPIC